VLYGVAILGILEVVEWTEPDADAVSTNGLAHFLDDLEHKPRPVLDGAAVLVGTLVDVVVEELVQKITVGAMNPTLDIQLNGCSNNSGTRLLGTYSTPSNPASIERLAAAPNSVVREWISSTVIGRGGNSAQDVPSK